MLACSLDLETSGFEADYNIILCAVIKPFRGDGSGKHTILRADKYSNWNEQRCEDSLICQALKIELSKYDILIAHNGARFDVPFIMTRFLRNNITWPQPKVIDPVRIARRYMRLGSNSLKAVCHHFGIEGKTETLGQEWMQAKFNRGATNKKAMDYVVEHCIADVDILEQAFSRIRHLVPKVSNFGSDI